MITDTSSNSIGDASRSLGQILGDRYQDGVRPGAKKLAQFREALKVRNTGPLMSQDGQGPRATAFVKLFDPCGSYTAYITEWDEARNEAFGFAGFGRTADMEFGYLSLEEIAFTRGPLGIGIEIDMSFRPMPLEEAVPHLRELV
jgi:hypothetical protein